MGFQDMPGVVHRAASAKGGRIRTKKGFALMSPDKRREAQSRGGNNAANRDREGAKPGQASGGDNQQPLADLLGDIDEQVQE